MGKEQLLEKIQRVKPDITTHPGSFKTEMPESMEQLFETFEKQAGLVGAEVTEFDNKRNIEQFFSEKFPQAIDFRKKENREKYEADCVKKELEKLNAVILEGQFAVAENGAIWVDDSNFSNRLIPFITEHLIVLLSNENLVATMHEAYEKIKDLEYSFGVFVSGPSKTADIEQSLVYGAHGAKALNIVLY